MGVGMKIRIKGHTEETTAWKKRIYFTYDNVDYVVNLFHDMDSGYELYWVKEGEKDYPDTPKWVGKFEEEELKGMSFMSWLDDETENS